MCRSPPPKSPYAICDMLMPKVKEKKPWALAMYAEQMLLQKNYESFFKYNEEAIELGLSRAIHNMGKCFEEGWGVTLNLTKALEWYERGIKSNCSNCMGSAGYIYMTSSPPLKNEKRAVELWEKCAAMGDRIAQNNIGSCYERGKHSLTVNKATAFKWYKLSADAGYQVTTILQYKRLSTYSLSFACCNTLHIHIS